MTKKNTVGEDIAVIKNQITNLSKNFEDFKNDNKKFIDGLTRQMNDVENRQNDVENKQIATSERVSNLTVFQTTLSVVIGAVATYLGVSKGE